jgi:hypothetical protein
MERFETTESAGSRRAGDDLPPFFNCMQGVKDFGGKGGSNTSLWRCGGGQFQMQIPSGMKNECGGLSTAAAPSVEMTEFLGQASGSRLRSFGGEGEQATARAGTNAGVTRIDGGAMWI